MRGGLRELEAVMVDRVAAGDAVALPEVVLEAVDWAEVVDRAAALAADRQPASATI